MTFPERVKELHGDWITALQERGVDWADSVVDEIIDSTRWTNVIRKVYPVGINFYEIVYEEGATEYQEDDYSESVEVNLVRPVQRVIVDYERV